MTEIRMALPVRNARIKLPQGQVFWREVGQGTTLIFLHGSWREGDQWMPVIEHLSSTYHCLAPDLLGCGESECLDSHYSIELEVECLAKYHKALNMGQVYLVAHSLGAWVAISFALKYPKQVKGLVLLAPEGIRLREHRNRWLGARLLLNPIVYGGLRLFRPIARLVGIKTIEQALQRRRLLLQSPATCTLLFQRRWAEIKAESLQDRLVYLSVPVLVLQGEGDRSDAAPLSYACAQLAPQAKFIQVPQAGEDLPQSQPERVASYIQEFVN
jgi:pimeloyl-ACP methyl ester carboxylesterase